MKEIYVVAYIDPGILSILGGLLISSLAAGLVMVGVFWKKIKGVFKRDKEE